MKVSTMMSADKYLSLGLSYGSYKGISHDFTHAVIK